MLVAQIDGKRIEARDASRAADFLCPGCGKPVILKKGRIVAAHFAHKPPFTCNYGIGETHSHRQAKLAFRDEYLNRGLRAEVEYEVPCLLGDRRADVLVWSPAGRCYAIELQHVSIGYDELEKRTQSYLAEGVRVIWIPFINQKKLENSKQVSVSAGGGLRIERYAVRPIERWLDALSGC